MGASWTKRLFLSAWSASLVHAWAMSSSSSFVWVSLASLAKRTQVSAHWRYRYGRTGSPAEARTRKVSCCDAAKPRRYDGIFVANVPCKRKPPDLRTGGFRLRLPTRDREGGLGTSRLASTIY